MDDPITFNQVLSWIGNHFLTIITVLAIFFQITPIKISPITWLIDFVLKPVRKDISDMKEEVNNNINSVKTELKEEIDQIKNKQLDQENSIKELIKSNELTEVSRIRWEILEFANSLANDVKHTRDEYRHIIDDNRKYHALVNKYDAPNGFLTDEYAKIETHYNAHKNDPELYF